MGIGTIQPGSGALTFAAPQEYIQNGIILDSHILDNISDNNYFWGAFYPDENESYPEDDTYYNPVSNLSDVQTIEAHAAFGYFKSTTEQPRTWDSTSADLRCRDGNPSSSSDNPGDGQYSFSVIGEDGTGYGSTIFGIGFLKPRENWGSMERSQIIIRLPDGHQLAPDNEVVKFDVSDTDTNIGDSGIAEYDLTEITPWPAYYTGYGTELDVFYGTIAITLKKNQTVNNNTADIISIYANGKLANTVVSYQSLNGALNWAFDGTDFNNGLYYGRFCYPTYGTTAVSLDGVFLGTLPLAFRCYNRPLTAAEIRNNYLMDVQNYGFDQPNIIVQEGP